MFIPPLLKLVEQFERMPGIGHKTAVRLAFYTLNLPEEKAKEFSDAIMEAKEKVKLCPICQDLTDEEPCKICSDPRRDHTTLCVMETPANVITMENTHEYSGLYHVLHGAISPMEDIGPDDIKIKELLARLSDPEIKEIIMATNPTVEGEATAMYLARLIKPMGIKVTRIAHGVPVGGDLEYADQITLTRAMEGRHEI